MKILIDCGAHKGKALEFLFAKHGSFDKIYMFECNPKLYIRLKNNLIGKRLNLEISSQAVWIKEEKLSFYLGIKNHKESSSLILGKKGTQANEKIEVEGFDFSNWIKETFSKNDEIIIKMDIEGAEYPVVESLLRDRTIEMIKVLYCEWHARRLKPKEENIKRHEALMEKLKKEKVLLGEWS